MPPRRFAAELTAIFDDSNYVGIAKETEKWTRDLKARQKVDKELMEKGYDTSYISTAALNQAAEHIDALTVGSRLTNCGEWRP